MLKSRCISVPGSTPKTCTSLRWSSFSAVPAFNQQSASTVLVIWPAVTPKSPSFYRPLSPLRPAWKRNSDFLISPVQLEHPAAKVRTVDGSCQWWWHVVCDDSRIVRWNLTHQIGDYRLGQILIVTQDLPKLKKDIDNLCPEGQVILLFFWSHPTVTLAQ